MLKFDMGLSIHCYKSGWCCASANHRSNLLLSSPYRSVYASFHSQLYVPFGTVLLFHNMTRNSRRTYNPRQTPVLLLFGLKCSLQFDAIKIDYRRHVVLNVCEPLRNIAQFPTSRNGTLIQILTRIARHELVNTLMKH